MTTDSVADDTNRPGEVADAALDGAGVAEAAVARRTSTGWRIGGEDVPDLTSAMVLADLIAAELPADVPATAAAASDRAGSTPGGSPGGSPQRQPGQPALADPAELTRTVAQLEQALTARVRVEQAIGVLAERHRLRPRQAFELLRSAARSRGRRVLEIAAEVVDSATNPLLRIPEELAKPPVARRRPRAAGQRLRNT